MPTVQTARGPVDTADLGPTLMHEHIFLVDPEIQQNYPQEWGSEEERIADAVAKLNEVASLGFGTIVDPTVIGLGRYLPRIAKVAEQVDLNIVCATGLYTYDDVPFFFHHRGPALNEAVGAEVPDPMVDMFVGDIRDGVAGTSIKAGLLKCAIDHQGLTPGVERVMRAVALAHKETGTPITVHTHPGSQQGLAVKKIFDAEGVDPRHVVLGHSGDTTDADHLSELADAGFLLGMDRFGINLTTTFEARADIVVEMCRRGYAESMVLSQDASCYFDWIQQDLMALLPDWKYTHIHERVIPYLLEQGVTQEQVDTMLVSNPRRYFEGASA